MMLQCVVDRFKAKSGLKDGQPKRYAYEIDRLDNNELVVLCTAGQSSKSGLRSLDPWLMYFVHELEFHGARVKKISIKIDYDEKQEVLESLSRRLSYLCINNGWGLEIDAHGHGLNTYDSVEKLFNRNPAEIVRTSQSEYRDRSDNKEGKVEKDFQTFIFGNSLAAMKDDKNTNERLAIFGEDFFDLKNKCYPIVREFPTGAFNKVISSRSRILPTYFIDFVTLNKYRQLSLIELKLNDSSLDSMAQLLDYALFFGAYKKELTHALAVIFDFKINTCKKFVCYIANNYYHGKFSCIQKFYSPKTSIHGFEFELKKVVLGHTTSLVVND